MWRMLTQNDTRSRNPIPIYKIISSPNCHLWEASQKLLLYRGLALTRVSDDYVLEEVRVGHLHPPRQPENLKTSKCQGHQANRG